ncbi:MAG: toll/interleukin-1 receptor domain-containing protein [Desulfotomaculaceae bacterium]|nr:toll/interleukin-1 receptor domain-containing protein [Desulfotomaculaceae bacterium]
MPKVFISYAWATEEHNNWVKDFAQRLRKDGVEVTLDQWHLALGDQLPEFMERSIRENDYILIVCTPKYKAKSDSRAGGVGYEGDIMTGEVLSDKNDRKFIPILREGEWNESAPSWLKGKKYVDLRDDANFKDNSYEMLLMHIHNIRLDAPALGGRFDELFKGYDENFQTNDFVTIDISGRWIDSANYDTIYFKQIGNRAVGIYNYGYKRKTGVLIGEINNRIFEFKWKWFEIEYRGYGNMRLSNNNKLLLGIWWYENKENLIDHVGYRYVSKEIPDWLNENDFEDFNYFLFPDGV